MPDIKLVLLGRHNYSLIRSCGRSLTIKLNKELSIILLKELIDFFIETHSCEDKKNPSANGFYMTCSHIEKYEDMEAYIKNTLIK